MDFEAHFRDLRERFKARLVERLEMLRTATRVWSEAPHDENSLKTIRSLAHDLAGSSGTFGFDELGELAARLETAAERVLAGLSDEHGLQTALQALTAALDGSLGETSPISTSRS